MNIKKVEECRKDFDNGIMLSRVTISALIDFAIEAAQYKEAYHNMKAFAEQNGLDTVTTGQVQNG